MQRFELACLAMVISLVALAPQSMATPLQRHDCYSKDVMRRIEGCTKLLETPHLVPQARAEAYGMRVLALSLLGRFDEAVADYDHSLKLRPNSAITLNNRSWALFRMGRVEEALPGVQKSLRYDNSSQHAYDTRAHIWQAKGLSNRAYRDYRKAMDLGGIQMVRLYQCGLQANGLYQGPITGIFTKSLDSALRVCVKRTNCDPLPADEECKAALS